MTADSDDLLTPIGDMYIHSSMIVPKTLECSLVSLDGL